MKLIASLNQKVPEGNPLFQCLATVTATLSVITSGMHYGWTSPSLPKLENSTLTISGDEGSWIAVMPLIGAVIGSTIAATTVDILGRKRAIILIAFPFFTSWVMIAFINSVTILYIARFIAGAADGWTFTVVPMYVGEIASPHIRGLLGGGVSVSWIFGLLLINIIGSYTSITTAALISSLLPVIFLLTFIWMPESPYYYVMRNQHDDAKESLRKFLGKEDVENELSRISKAVKAQTENSGKFLDLFTTKSNRKAILIMMGLRTAQQISGTTAITFYTQKIFEEAGDDISSELASIIYFSIQFIVSVFCTSIVDRAGRRPLLIISITGSAVALFIEGVYFVLKTQTNIEVTNFSYIPVVALLGFVVIFSLGMQSIPILMLGEMFPANVKAFALCWSDIYFSIVATIISKFFQIMKDNFGIYVPFFAFSGLMIIGLIFICMFVPETKGKTLEEIQLYLGGKTGKEVIVEEKPDKAEPV